MRELRKLGLLAISIRLFLGFACVAKADVVIDFEGYSSKIPITNQYTGVAFQDAIVLNAPDLDSVTFPPHSGTNVVYSGKSSSLTATAVGGTWGHIGLWYTTTTGLSLKAYDSSNTLLTSSNGGVNAGTSSYLEVSATDIAYVIAGGSGEFFTIDDFSYHQSIASVPEPSTLAVATLGGVMLVLYARRREPSA